MTPQEIRTQRDFIAKIFELECKVKPDFGFHIIRDAYGVIEILFIKKGDSMNPHYRRFWMRYNTDISTKEAMHTLVAHIWDCIPDECKKEL